MIFQIPFVLNAIILKVYLFKAFVFNAFLKIFFKKCKMPFPLEIHLFKFQGEGKEALMNIIQFQFLKNVSISIVY